MKPEKIMINGKEYTLKRKIYDSTNNCYFYYTYEEKEPFCDLCDIVEDY